MPDPSRYFPDQLAPQPPAINRSDQPFDLVAYLFRPPNPPIPPPVDPRHSSQMGLWRRRTPAGGFGVEIRYTETLVRFYRNVLPPEDERPKRVIFTYTSGHRDSSTPISYIGRAVGPQKEPEAGRPPEVFAYMGRTSHAPNPLNARRIEILGYRHPDPTDQVMRYGLLGLDEDRIHFVYEWDFVGKNSWAFTSTENIAQYCLKRGRPNRDLDEFLLFRGEPAPAAV